MYDLFNPIPEVPTKDITIKPSTMSFFNTIGLKGIDLLEATMQCGKQEYRVLCLMLGGQSYTPFDVHDIYEKCYARTPITSIRRAMTCLEKKGFIEKVGMKNERYGKPNNTWRIKLGI
jgi:hypothetical protein